MSILNQAAVEALCSATYLENYLETMENLPDDLQRVVTQLRELDIQCRDILHDSEHHKEVYLKEEGGPAKRKAFIALQRILVKCQEIGDEKLHLLSVINDFIENRSRQLEQDRENLDPTAARDHEEEKKVVPVVPPIVNNIKVLKQPEEKVEKVQVVAANKRQRRQKLHDSISRDEEKELLANSADPDETAHTSGSTLFEDKDKIPKKRKKKKVKLQKEQSPIDPPIDPDEPTYCLCEQVSYGEMIGCDNDGCPIEWFHFNCVGLTTKPKGKWFCPKCRGDTSKLMKKF